MNVDRPGRIKEVLFIIGGALSVAVGTIVFSPVLTKNVLFLAALPFVAGLFIILVLNIQATFVFVLATRALMDLSLSYTRVGAGAGIGGILNLFVIMMIAFLILRFPKTLSAKGPVRAWALFLGLCALSLLYSPIRGVGLRFLLNLMTYFCMFAAPFFLVKTLNDKRFWMKVLLFSSFLPVLFALIGMATGIDPLVFRDGRLRGTFGHPNVLAFYLVFVMTVVLIVLKTQVIKLTVASRLGLWLYLGAVLAALLGTETRSAWLSCAFLFLAFGLLKDRKLLIAGIVGAVLLMALPQVQTRISELSEGTGAKKGETLNSWTWRVKLWEASIPEIKRRIITGHGLESFQVLSKDFFYTETAFRYERDRGYPAHNVYIELLFEVGLLGLLAYLWIYGSLLKTFFIRMRLRSRDASTEGAVLFIYVFAYLLVNASDNMMHYLAFNWNFWFLCGLMVRSALLEREVLS